MHVSFPGESSEYRAARVRLLAREAALRRATEAVAAARRELPPGGLVPQDYVFAGREGAVRMSELFASGKHTLAIYSFMYGPDSERPCPMCSSLLDGLEGAAEHLAMNLNFVVVARAPLAKILAVAEQRGWRRLRLLSSHGNSYNRDYLGENEEGAQEPMLNVFRREGTQIRHRWGSELLYAPSEPGQDPRHVDSLSPLWNLLDFTPDGREGATVKRYP